MAPKRKARKAPPAAADQAPSPAEDEATGNAEEVVVVDDSGGGGGDEEAAPKPSSKKARAAAASKSEKKAKAEKPFVKKAVPSPKKGKKVAVEDKKGIDKGEAENEENEEDDEEDEEVVEEHKIVHQKQSVQQTSLIIIEASKECNVFKTRAAKVQEDLKKALSGIEVLVNPDKPRRGCFEIRSKEGEVFISLQNMPRPFKKLRDVDLDNLVGEIVAQVKK